MLKQTKKVSEYELPIKIEPQKEGGYVVTCPKWSDCFAQGDTVDRFLFRVERLLCTRRNIGRSDY
ncbi:MAG: hypothetical protein UT54_C0072G0004 [Candidatus Daviesbacteria bacterium GW2011_GWB1_39_5]|nr:MAG: hypothetical protein UT54_C0072G0004 [Candidatus Daviesbacteria bacterium GW2011_GWB1_39_5]